MNGHLDKGTPMKKIFFTLLAAAAAPVFAQVLPPAVPNAMPPGLYVQVIDGLINVSNKGGTQNFAAGQFGFTPSPTQPPVVVPKNPGIMFTPPPAFSAPPTNMASSTPPKSGSVDCEVR